MTLTPTLTLYVARGFFGATLAMLAALTGLVSLFDFIELLRRAASRPDVGFDIPANIAALRLPFVALQILPFAILLGGIVAFWRLTRSSELIVARAVPRSSPTACRCRRCARRSRPAARTAPGRAAACPVPRPADRL